MIQWGSLFVAVLMVASILGYSLLGSSSTTPGEDVPPAEPPPIDIPELVFFESEMIDANVAEVFASLTVVASTPETEINLIDAQLYGVEGVWEVSSFYSEKGATEISLGLGYTANIVLKVEADRAKVMEEIREKATKLTNIAFYANGLIQIPQEISFEKTDLNLTKLHRFDEPFVQAILSAETLKGDQIRAKIQAGFRGDVPSNVIALELSNLSGADQSIFLTAEKTISSLSKELSLSARAAYSGEKFEGLEGEIKALAGVSEASVEVMPLLARLQLSFDKIEDEGWADLNAILYSVDGITDLMHWSDESETTVYIEFDEESDYAGLKTGIEEALAGQGIEAEWIEPESSITADLNTTSIQTKALDEGLRALLEDKGFSSIKAFQKGEVDLATESLVDEETGQGFALAEELRLAPAWVLPGYETGETVLFEIYAVGNRGQVKEVQLIEKTD